MAPVFSKLLACCTPPCTSSRAQLLGLTIGFVPPNPSIPPSHCRPQKFSLLGSTGSIGTQTLDIVAEQPDKFAVTALAAGGNLELLAEQVGVCCGL